MFERWVVPSVFIDFTNTKYDKMNEVPGYRSLPIGIYIHRSPVM